MLRAELRGSGEGLRIPVHCHHPSAQRAGDHHHAEAYTPGTYHGDPLPVGDPSPADQRAVCRGEPASETGRGGKVDLLGDGHQVDIGIVERDVLSKRPPACEAWLLLIRADLSRPRPAPLAAPTAADERDGHPVADPPLTNLRTDLSNHSSELMARHVRPGDLLMTRPAMPVTAAHPARHHSDHHPAGQGRWVRHLPHLRLSSNGIDDYGTHPYILPA